MVFEFKRDEIIALDFQARTRFQNATATGKLINIRYAKREFLLWPALAYRVVVPRFRTRQLNVFQRAILGLSQAGVISPEEIANKLHIHRDLTAFVINELTEKGFLDSYGMLTDSGSIALKGDEIEAHEMAAGFVFQDPWSGDLWPRFMERLDYSEIEYGDGPYPRLVFRNRERTWSTDAFLVEPRAEAPQMRPTAVEILDAAKKHHVAKKQLGDDGNEEDEQGTNVSSTYFDRISFIEDEAWPVYLTTFLYIPEGGLSRGGWRACDPFGLGDSPRLHNYVEAQMETNRGLRDRVERLFSASKDDIQAEARHDEEIEDFLKRKFDSQIVNLPVFKELSEMERGLRNINLCADDSDQYAIKNVITAARRTIEATFKGIASSHPITEVWKDVHIKLKDPKSGRTQFKPQSDQEIVAAIIQSAASRTGFAERIPKSFTSARPGNIRSVAEYGEWGNITRAVCAAILAASTDESHPLRHAARAFPHLLREIDDLTDICADAAHTSERVFSIEMAGNVVARVYDIVEILTKQDQMDGPSNQSGGEDG